MSLADKRHKMGLRLKFRHWRFNKGHSSRTAYSEIDVGAIKEALAEPLGDVEQDEKSEESNLDSSSMSDLDDVLRRREEYPH